MNNNLRKCSSCSRSLLKVHTIKTRTTTKANNIFTHTYSLAKSFIKPLAKIYNETSKQTNKSTRPSLLFTVYVCMHACMHVQLCVSQTKNKQTNKIAFILFFFFLFFIFCLILSLSSTVYSCQLALLVISLVHWNAYIYVCMYVHVHVSCFFVVLFFNSFSQSHRMSVCLMQGGE